MKDAKGHGSNPRGAHAAGTDQVGRSPLQLAAWYHGSPSGEPGANGPVHVGTAEAAREALEARIGTPADGRGWDGTREYGKTLLAGSETQARLEATGVRPKYTMGTGQNADAPKNDYYASERVRATYGDSSPVPDDARPAVHSYNIVGAMSNTPLHAYDDARANGMAKRLKNNGVYYKNIGEDSGSVSAVVPNKTHLRRVP